MLLERSHDLEQENKALRWEGAWGQAAREGGCRGTMGVGCQARRLGLSGAGCTALL